MKNEVFISHRGPDTKLTFVDSLYQELKRKNVQCFFDRTELQLGQQISNQILRALKDANICVIVFSACFADSTWCNTEVLEAVKAMEMHPDHKIIYPVFHGVTPRNVRHDGYRDSFATLTSKGYATEEEVREWKSAFTRVSAISGHEVDLNERTSVTTEKIANDICEMLLRAVEEDADPSGDAYVDGEGRVADILSKFQKSAEMVTSVGITGPGGIGKTRLAEEVYNRIQAKFEASYFLRNVRDLEAKKCGIHKLLVKIVKGISKVEISESKAQQYLFRQKRLSSVNVLLVLDDVESHAQLQRLLPPLGGFSRVIVTSRDRDSLRSLTFTHEVDQLKHPEARLLFEHHNKPDAALDRRLVEEIVGECKGVPLVLEMAGLKLQGKSDERDWRGVKTKLGSYPEVVDKLRISLESLHQRERDLFLDICCFFGSVSKASVCWIWEAMEDIEVTHDINVLLNKHLLRLDTADLTLMPYHDLIRDMAREEVNRESQNSGERSRIWNYKEADKILTRSMGTAKIRTMTLAGTSRDACCFNTVNGLAFLNMGSCHISGDFKQMPPLNYLRWRGMALDALPSSFIDRLKKTVSFLDLSGSNITRLGDEVLLDKLMELVLDNCRGLTSIKAVEPCNEIRSISLRFCSTLTILANFREKLEMLDLTGCKTLTQLPDFPSHCRIRILSLRWCSRILGLPDSIGNLEKLETFDLAGTSVSSLPEAFGNMKSLEHLDISSCKSLYALPTSFSALSHLKSLHMFGCGIVKLHQGFGQLKSLSNLNLADCLQLIELSPDFGKLVSLETLILKNCEKFSMLPEGFDNLKSLVKLDLEGCGLVQLPDDFGGLGSLKRLNIAYSRIQAVPFSVSYLNKTEQLRLDHCFLLSEVSGLPGTLANIPGQLQVLDMGNCFQLEVLPDLGELHNLEQLILCNCVNLKEIHGLDRLSSLTTLNLSGCCQLSNFNVPGLDKCKSLQHLYLSGSKVHISPSDLEVLSQLQTISYFSSRLTPNCKNQLAVPVHLKNNEATEPIVPIQEKILLKETVSGDRPVEAIVFQIVAHDQGWSDYEHLHGRYIGNSYFEVRVSRGGAVSYTYTIVFNRHADGRDQLHICLFRNNLPGFVGKLVPGDIVSLHGVCKFLKWELRVRQANMKIFYHGGRCGALFSHNAQFTAELKWQRWRYTVADWLPCWLELHSLAALDLAHTEFTYHLWENKQVVAKPELNEQGEQSVCFPQYRLFEVPSAELRQCVNWDSWSQQLSRPMWRTNSEFMMCRDECFQAQEWAKLWHRHEERPFFRFSYGSHLHSKCDSHILYSTNVGNSFTRVQLVYRDW